MSKLLLPTALRSLRLGEVTDSEMTDLAPIQLQCLEIDDARQVTDRGMRELKTHAICARADHVRERQ